MSDRISAFLATTHADGWTQHPLAGDASTRRYVRLTSQTGETSILMDAANAEPDDMKRFVLIDEALRDAGLSAPEIYSHDPSSGLMLLEDFGAVDVAKSVHQYPKTAARCYDVATDVLLRIPQVVPLPLPVFDAESAARWLAPLGDWYNTTPCDISPIQAALTEAFDALGLEPNTLALRDYHAENLMWRPERTGLDCIGLLDFQDALYAPAGYDLASLTRDARRDVDPALAQALTEKMAKSSGTSLADYTAQVALLAVQRNLRILGIFASLSKRDNKPEYAAFAPRVWTYLSNDLGHPALTKLRHEVLSAIPEPTQHHLSRWAL